MAGCVMSVLGLVPQRIGGIEMFLRELSSQLAGSGWKSVICFLRSPVGNVRQFFEIPGVTIEELAPQSERWDWTAGRRATALIRRYRPDVLHLSFVDFVSFCPWLARCCSVRRIFLSDHCSRPEGYFAARSAWWKRAIRQGLNWPITRVVGVSDYIVQSDEALGLARRGKFRRIYNGVDLTRPLGDGSRFRRKHAIPANRMIVLQVSWMIPEKGIIDLLDAARSALSVQPDLQFVISGEGAHRTEFMKYAVEQRIADHITWTGLLEDPLGEGAYDAADVVCHLSRWEEAFGLVIAEAMACRKPVVATNVGGIPEVVKDGTTGFLVPPRRPDAAAQKILQLLSDAPLRRRMGEAGRARVEEHFDLISVVQEWIALYGAAKGVRTMPSARVAHSG